MVTGLVRDDRGRVCGARVREAGKTIFFRGRDAVILTTGGFGVNAEMLAEYFPGLPATAVPTATPASDGSGLKLAMGLGAAVGGMDGMIASGSIYPPEQLIKGIIVNRDGHRFVAEDSYHGRTGAFIAEQPGQRAYLIVDSETFAYPEMTWANHSLIDGFETIAEMEARLDIPAGALVGTMNDYNRHAARGVDPLFFKDPSWIQPLDNGPWAAFDISFDRSTYLYVTLGGLRIDVEARVLARDGGPIPGLYAAGASTAQFCRDGKAYASGVSLGSGSYFGRVAGRNAAASRR
jgi:succinate dehydrogenase/fumarate reductase flavoprotein subunit